MGYVIDIYKPINTCISMKLRDVLSKVVENKKNGQLNTCIRKTKLKEAGISEEDLFNMKIDSKLAKLLK